MLALLLAAEFGLRSVGTRLSGDVAHLEAVPTIVDRTLASEAEPVLLWGNSLLGEGVDARALEAGLEALGSGAFTVGKVNPDGTTPMEWSFLLRSNVTGGVDDVARGTLVLAFGPGHLLDRSPQQTLERLALYHVGPGDLGRFLGEELHTLEDRAAFLAARGSRLVALGERIQPRVLDLVIPRYRERAPILLARDGGGAAEGVAGAAGLAGPEGAAGPVGAAPPPPPGPQRYRHFRTIVDDAARAGIPLVLLPMPQPQPWELSPGERRIIQECGATVLELADAAGIPPEHFPDGTHMDETGRRMFTETLAPALAELLQGPREALIPRRCPGAEDQGG